MTAKKLRLGVVGASPVRGWFKVAHLPALQLLSDRIEITAVCTSRPETARVAAEATGARYAFDDYRQLVTCPDVDLVVTAVKTSLHGAVVESAIAAGKNVFCEWPLGHGAAEAERLVADAKTAGIRNMVSLQGRMSPVVNTVRDLIESGYIGRPLSASIVASGFGWGGFIDPSQVYLFDATAGSSMLNIAGGHLLDCFTYACDEFREVSARMATQRTRAAVLDAADVNRLRAFAAELEPEGAATATSPKPDVLRADGWFTPTSPDQIALHGVLDNGAIASVHIRGGQHRGTNLLWEINGDEGELRVVGSAGMAQMFDLTLTGGRGATPQLSPLPLTEEYRESAAQEPGGPASNIWRLYKAYLGDAPASLRPADFAAALRHQRFIDVIQAAATSGRTMAFPQ